MYQLSTRHRIATLLFAAAAGWAGLASAQSCAPPPPGLVGWWPGDGNTNDIQGGNHGIEEGNPSYAPGFVASGNGQAFSLDNTDGIDDFIRVPFNPLNLNLGAASFSFEFWTNSPLTSPNQGFLIKSFNGPNTSGGTGIEIRSLGTSLEYVRNDGTPNPAFLPPSERLVRHGLAANSWNHIVATYDIGSQTGRLYVNASLASTGQFIVHDDFHKDILAEPIGPSGPYNDSFDLLIGQGAEASGGTLNGLIDELQLYNRALTAAEIQASFNAGSAGRCKSALDLLAALSQAVIELNLKKGINMSLDAKLSTVLQALQDANANNDGAAVNVLGAFINAVEAQRNKEISSADADVLINIAQQVIAQLQPT